MMTEDLLLRERIANGIASTCIRNGFDSIDGENIARVPTSSAGFASDAVSKTECTFNSS